MSDTQQNNQTTPAAEQTSSVLVGYLRRSNKGGAIKLSLAKDAIDSAERYMGQDGTEYIGLVASLERVKEIIAGERDVTSVVQLTD